MKYLLSFTLVIFLCTISYGDTFANDYANRAEGKVEHVVNTAKPAKTHFRGAYWGTSMQEVKATLTDKDEITENDDEILIIKNSDTNDYIIAYWFVDDKLTHGVYMYDEDHYNKNLYLDEYEKMQSILIEKYGAPELNEWIWSDDLYKDDVQDYGMAVSLGHLTGITDWKIGGMFYNTEPESNEDSVPIITNIRLGIMGDNFKIGIAICYYSTEYYHLFEENEKKKNERNF